MKLITFEIRMSHINGPEHDWWQPAASRIPDAQAEQEVARMADSDRYRNVAVQDDPHEGHSEEDIARSTSGLSAWCTVEGCSWSWDYD